jgi:hypothetical protein
MKTIKIITLLTGIFAITAAFSHAIDIEAVTSHDVHDRLMSLTEPGAPVIVDDMIIFTAPSSQRRVGVAFADEHFAKVHWFRRLIVPRDPLEIPIVGDKVTGTDYFGRELSGEIVKVWPEHGTVTIKEKDGSESQLYTKTLTKIPEKRPNPYKDSGIMFHVYQIPEGVTEIEYRLVINGLWTADPANPDSRRDGSGLSRSVISLPKKETVPGPLKRPPGSLSFSFEAPPGETVTVAGNFNGWDPFMYELREGPAGNYTINIPLPPGTYQYVFFHRGQRYLDPYNARRIYAKDGKAASEIVIQ